jgi:hypothetical protein
MSGPHRYQVTVDVEAWQWEGTDADIPAVLEWIAENGGRAWFVPQLALIRIDIDGRLCYAAAPGDWIIRGTTGSFFTKRPGEFAERYMAVTAT